MSTKRKQGADSNAMETSDTTGQVVSISIDEAPANIQPVLATFLGAVPPVASLFSTYRPIAGDETDNCIVVNETDRVEYVGQTFEDSKPLLDGCKYLIGIYDSKTDTVVFRQAPYVRVKTVIKSLKSSHGVVERRESRHIPQALNELGVKFGNMRLKATVSADELNKINMDSLGADMDVIGASIEKSSSFMLSMKEIAMENDKSLPVPKFNAEAETAAEIYDVDDVLSKKNAGFINVAVLAKTTDPVERKRLIPGRSTFVANKVEQIISQKKPDLALLRRVIYLAYLMKFYYVGRNGLQNRETCARILTCSPEIINTIFDRFTEGIPGSVNPDGSPVHVKTPACENRLMCHILVLMLSLNNWVLIPTEVAADMAMDSRSMQKYLEYIGCENKTIDDTE
ncbi:DNA-directed RNA polymerase I subunit rpa49 [Coemansia aciculifera]|nr:DNA-directed RNA polymerase I subunit rpa49 [Coemansia aciculifera]